MTFAGRAAVDASRRPLAAGARGAGRALRLQAAPPPARGAVRRAVAARAVGDRSRRRCGSGCAGWSRSLVQLVLLALILLALGDPQLSASQHGRTIAIVVDTSASMQADGRRQRPRACARRKDEAQRLVRGLGGDDEAMVVAHGRAPGAARRLSQRRARARSRRSTRSPPATRRPIWSARCALAGDALRGRQRPTLVLDR